VRLILEYVGYLLLAIFLFGVGVVIGVILSKQQKEGINK